MALGQKLKSLNDTNINQKNRFCLKSSNSIKNMKILAGD